MKQTVDSSLIAEAIGRLFSSADLPWPPPVRRIVAPVPLDCLIHSSKLVHEEVRGLTRAAAGSYLAHRGIQRPELLEDTSALAGFLFANSGSGYILVNADDPLPRRRFTAAHELGHYLLHFLPRLQATCDGETYLLQDDSSTTVREEEKPGDDKALSLPEMERQANRFAVELLMPEAVCRAAVDLYSARFKATARFLEHHLSGDLLVSRDAIRWRLRSLSLT